MLKRRAKWHSGSRRRSDAKSIGSCDVG